MAKSSTKKNSEKSNVVTADFGALQSTEVSTPQSYTFVQVNEFQPNVNGWNEIGNITKYTKVNAKTLLLENSNNMAIQLSFLSPTVFRVRFRPSANPDYTQKSGSYAVVNQNLAKVSIQVQEIDRGGKALQVDTGGLTLYIGLQPYGISVYQNGKLVTEDEYGKNLVYSNQAVACIRKAPDSENYYGFGEKAGATLNKKSFTMSCFNYDNFTYAGTAVIPDNNQPGPLNPSEPLYNSMPVLLATGKSNSETYSYAVFLDNVGQSYFNLGSNDYSNMDGKYYFGTLYGDLDYYVIVGDDAAQSNNNPIRSVLDQYSKLTGPSPMPPKYALGYQQGCYGYYSRKILQDVAQNFRDFQIPIDGLHIDVDFQNNYRTFTSSPEKFPNPQEMFAQLHESGFKCSTNITGIISANPLDEDGNRDTPYPARDSFVTISLDNSIAIKPGEPIPFIYNTRADRGESPDLFLANESYGDNNGFNPYKYPTPLFPNGQNGLGTYGFYSDMGKESVQLWWGEQYDYLLSLGLDMIWQDMTCPAVVPNSDNETPDKTLPLNLMMYDKVSDEYQPNAVVHNAFALNLIEATWNGISKLKSSKSYKNSKNNNEGLNGKKYNYNKRNFIIARGGYAGVHRYAASWTGDSASSWDFLKINIPEVLNFGLTGQALSGCDVGGFANGSGSEGGGVTNYELFTRWMTMSSFLPWFRNHYDGYTKTFQEPYRYAEPVPSICRKYIEIRYRLIQLFYDAMYQNTQLGLPIARALFVNDPQDPEVYNHVDDQFFVGDNLLIAPIVDQGSVNRDIYLPNGSQWYVYSDNTAPLGAPTDGGTTQSWYVPLDLVPMYVREGAILPHRELEQYIGQLDSNPITFNIYPGKDSSYTLYQDDHVSTDNVEQKAYRVTDITHSGMGSGQQVSVKRMYDNYTPPEPFYYVSFLGTATPSSVTNNGKVLSDVGGPQNLNGSTSDAYYFNESIATTFVKIFDTQTNTMLTVLFS
ncbi:MAG: alpha-glucosidase [Lentisphaeria bacterium]|jgi:alpha-glucosidase